MNILNKKIDFLCPTNFKLLSKTKENAIKFVISISGGPYFCLPWVSKNLATPVPGTFYCSEHLQFACTSILRKHTFHLQQYSLLRQGNNI
jgi:hypothetical protein